MHLRGLIFSLLFFGWISTSRAQEIDFSKYYNYNLTISELNNLGLDFGYIIRNSGLNSVDINNSKIVTITGVKYLDVIVEVSAENYLYLNGNPAYAGDAQKSVPFTLQAAYANNLGTPTIGNAKFLNVSNNYVIAQFPILERQNQPPGPPPTPPTAAFNQALVEESAYLYLFGSINVGNVNAGSYEGTITITINYD